MSFLSTDPCLSFWYLIPYLFHPVIYSGNSLFCYGEKKISDLAAQILFDWLWDSVQKIT